MKFIVLLLIFMALAGADKLITAVNISQLNKNFPDSVKGDEFIAERNPVAKWFFVKFGLIGGTLIFYPLSVGLLFLSYRLLRVPFNDHISLYVLFMIMMLVIGNNTYFFLKYSKII